MSTVETLLREIRKFPQNEVEKLIRRLLQTPKTASAKKRITGKYIGVGKGLWKGDAQQYVKRGRIDNWA